MFSWEISKILNKNNYNITIDIYNNICKSSQISMVKYDAFSDYFEIWTKDDYYWKFRIKKEKHL